MEIDQIAAWANIIASLGIMVTVIFLAYEIHSSRLASRRAARDALIRGEKDLEFARLRSGKRARGYEWVKLTENLPEDASQEEVNQIVSQFSEDELDLIHSRLFLIAWNMDSVITAREIGVITEDEWLEWDEGFRGVLSPFQIKHFNLFLTGKVKKWLATS